MNSARSEIGAAERAELFHEQYGNEIDAGTTLADLVIAAGDYLALIVGRDEVDVGMSKIVEGVVSVAGESVREPSGWRRALDASRQNCFSEWELGPRLHDLAAYAVYGIVLEDSDEETDPAVRIERLLSEAEAFVAATPLDRWQIGSAEPRGTDLFRLVRLARNRWALDNGRPVEPAALAEFGGVSEGRVRNMMAGANRIFTPEDGLIPASEALPWLGGRKEFWNSIWREQRLHRYGARRRPPFDRPVFVPVARDGSAFHPGLRRGAGYTVGEKGEERRIADFDTALTELQRMPVPYWRRPNASGHWGVVAGIRWQRLDASDLEVLAATPDHKIPDHSHA
jgi:hypothetical protein